MEDSSTPHGLGGASGAALDSVDSRILADFGYFGHYLHLHAGGLSGKQHLLIYLLDKDGETSQRELQESVPVSSATLSETLAKLESEGLIERTRSPKDRRQLYIRLTKSGYEIGKACAYRKRVFMGNALSPLSEEEKLRLLGMLDCLVDHWTDMEEDWKANQQ